MTHENHDKNKAIEKTEKSEKTEDIKTVILCEPIDYGDERITALYIKKPKARHLRAMPIAGRWMWRSFDSGWRD